MQKAGSRPFWVHTHGQIGIRTVETGDAHTSTCSKGCAEQSPLGGLIGRRPPRIQSTTCCTRIRILQNLWYLGGFVAGPTSVSRWDPSPFWLIRRQAQKRNPCYFRKWDKYLEKPHLVSGPITRCEKDLRSMQREPGARSPLLVQRTNQPIILNRVVQDTLFECQGCNQSSCQQLLWLDLRTCWDKSPQINGCHSPGNGLWVVNIWKGLRW